MTFTVWITKDDYIKVEGVKDFTIDGGGVLCLYNTETCGSGTNGLMRIFKQWVHVDLTKQGSKKRCQ